ncbi:MAG: nucleotidyl transferase AbiEii/AbiGii toxin family protein [bacterium]|nr:nucleotidyl transferase AbiEii/AbiGii toxin family protein [bacterium]
MAEQLPPDHFAGVLHDLGSWLRGQDVPGTIIGGVAASLLGRPRATRDVDVLVLLPEEHWPTFLASGGRFGFEPRRPDCLAFARQARVLLLRHGSTKIDLDVVFGSLPFEEEAVARSRWTEVAGAAIPLPTPEDLIIMKAVAQRPRDLTDIEAISAAHPDLDEERVLRWVEAFANALEIPGIVVDLRRLLAGRKHPDR